jgi:hypothetical protein
MKLTKEQIQLVENYLTKKKFKFIDLKAEILDHIIADIESLLIKNYSFENSFKITILKWEKHFRETSNFYLGFLYSESKIVVEKATKLFKPFYFLYLISYFLPVIIFKNFPIIVRENTSVLLNMLFKSIAIICLGYLFFIIIKVLTTKVKTTYSYILRTQYLGVSFLIFSLLPGTYFNDEGNVNAIYIAFLFGGFAVTYIIHYFFKKHQETVSNHKKYQLK